MSDSVKKEVTVESPEIQQLLAKNRTSAKSVCEGFIGAALHS